MLCQVVADAVHHVVILCVSVAFENDFVDLVASAFRLIDHTDFDRYASHLLKNLDCTNEENLIKLLSL